MPIGSDGLPLSEEIGLFSKSLLGRAHEASTKYAISDINGQFLRNGLKCYSSKADLSLLYIAVTGQTVAPKLTGTFNNNYDECLGTLELMIKSGKDVTSQKQMFKP